MSKATSVLVLLGLTAAVLVGYRSLPAPAPDRPPGLSDESVKALEKRLAAEEARSRGLQHELEALSSETARLRRNLEELNAAAAEIRKVALSSGFREETAQVAVSESGPPISANEVQAVKAITPLTHEELARRVELARQRYGDSLSPVAAADLANMPRMYEWGTGSGRRMWRMVDENTWYEVYPDGSYSVIPILGRATVNGSPGVVATKDDGSLDVFIPDKGNQMVHMIRGANSRGPWMVYSPMGNVE